MILPTPITLDKLVGGDATGFIGDDNGFDGCLASERSTLIEHRFLFQAMPTCRVDRVRFASRNDPTIPAALLRLHYHDCFVRGCDGSVLLDGARRYPPPEKAAPPNISLRGFKLIDNIKRVLEIFCPLTVSCADILALSAREAVVLAGGPNWTVPTGRKDSRMSSAVLAVVSLPQPHFTAAQLKQNFLWHGMSEDEMIILSGAHSIGFARCVTVWDRLYNYNFTMETDPSLNSSYADLLKMRCPRRSWNLRLIMLPLDPVTPFKFDTMYYKNLENGLGLLVSDQVLYDKRAQWQRNQLADEVP
ncbi:hypothetical protein GIB67_021924 [Kingdonia uniflora]|uniref:Peroxidase n=1 Tax=Kingdonia uniflora TaxID=39325 RepID=A0A7J7N4F1_9MAGN|nr:hypothetical protein GIB67_021924 [Kingdonia uniflora]